MHICNGAEDFTSNRLRSTHQSLLPRRPGYRYISFLSFFTTKALERNDWSIVAGESARMREKAGDSDACCI